MGPEGMVGFFAQNRMEGQNKGQVGQMGLPLADGSRHYPPSLLQHREFVPNAPSVTVAPIAPRGEQREEEVSFLFFLTDERVGAGRRGWLQMHQMLQLHHLHHKLGQGNAYRKQFCSLNGFAAKLQFIMFEVGSLIFDVLCNHLPVLSYSVNC
jgi:hypothetical protein